MKRARFTDEQIIVILKEQEVGAKTADLARKHGVSEATLYNWKAKVGGNIRAVLADGTYDGAPVYEAIHAARPERSPPRIVIPPGKTSIPARQEPHGGLERERHAA